MDMNRTRHSLSILLLITSMAMLGGCAGLDAGKDMISGLTDSLFGDDDTADPPATLDENFHGEMEIDTVWKEEVGIGAENQYFKLIPAVTDGIVFAADHKGLLQARNTQNGNVAWENSTNFHFAAGPGFGAQNLYLGTSDAEVVAFDKVTGEQRWSTFVSSEVMAVPTAEGGKVFIRTSDGRITALSEQNGSQIWSVEQTIPALSIRGMSRPLVVEDMLIIGTANGKLNALQLSDGKSIWEATVALPKGRSEIERLVDIDSNPVESRGAIYAASYQNGISSIAITDGDIIWRNENISSYADLICDLRYIYVSDTLSEISQIDQRSGASLWKQKDLHNRKTTGAALYNNFLVVGDFEGYVHWLSTTDGRLLARTKISDGAIDSPPVILDGVAYVYAKDGTLAALRAR